MSDPLQGHRPAGPGADEEPGLTVDARGLRCPLPVLRLAAAVRGLPPGTLAAVLATDPAVRHDVPAWARLRGHAHVATTVVATSEPDEPDEPDEPAEEVLRVLVRLGPSQPRPGTETGPDRAKQPGDGAARSAGSSER